MEPLISFSFETSNVHINRECRSTFQQETFDMFKTAEAVDERWVER